MKPILILNCVGSENFNNKWVKDVKPYYGFVYFFKLDIFI